MFELARISFTVIAYETEDFDKVKTAMTNLLPEHLREHEYITSQRITGQFKDTMYFMTLLLTKKKEVLATTQYIFSKLSKTDKIRFYNEYESRFDEKETTIHLRIDKFKAFNEEIALQKGSDVIKTTIKYNVYKKIDLTQIKESFMQIIGNNHD